MKRRDLIKLLEKNGWTFLRNGGNHDIYTNGTDNEPVSRQREIKEAVAKAIIRRRGLKSSPAAYAGSNTERRIFT